MPAYNIINPTSLVAGQPEDVSQVLANFQALAALLNGGLDDYNIKALAGIDPTKIAGGIVNVPIGSVLEWPYAVGNIPSWAALAYGQAIARASYPALNTIASAASYPHGSGDGSTTFNLPDFRGRAAIGKDDMGGTPANVVTVAVSGINGTTLGLLAGAQGITLTTAMIPAHNHGGATAGAGSTTDAQGTHSHGGATTGRSAQHNHTLPYTVSPPSGTNGSGLPSDAQGPYYKGAVMLSPGAGGGQARSGWTTDTETQDHTHGITADGNHSHNVSSHVHGINNDGGGGVHSNMQPILVVNKMMRVT